MNNEQLKKIPIAEYLIEHLGWQIVKQKDCRTWRAIISPSGEKIIARSYPLADGSYIYKNLDNGLTGTLPYLLKKNGATGLAPSIAFKLNDFKMPRNVQKREQLSSLHNKATNRLEKTRVNFRDSYLKERHIKTSPQALEKLLLKAKVNKFEASFPLFFSKKLIENEPDLLNLEIDREVPRACILGIATYKSKKDSLYPGQKRILGKKGISVLGDTREQIYVFESPIDALSYDYLCGWHYDKKTKAGRSGLYLSTCGALGGAQSRHLIEIIKAFQEQKKRKVFICFDNDEKGEKMGQRLASSLEKAGIEAGFLYPPHPCKDWNEFLIPKQYQNNTNLIPQWY